jgi:hypothetical protein
MWGLGELKFWATRERELQGKNGSCIPLTTTSSYSYTPIALTLLFAITLFQTKLSDSIVAKSIDQDQSHHHNLNHRLSWRSTQMPRWISSAKYPT